MAPLLHAVSERTCPQEVCFSQEYLQRTLAEDREILERIIAAYHHASSLAAPDLRGAMCGGVWGRNGLVGKQSSLIRALEDKSPAGLHDILRKYFTTDAAHGIAMGKDEADIITREPAHCRHYGLMWLDRLVGLAEATGAMSIPNPENPRARHQEILAVNPDTVVESIERKIGMRLTFPNICGVFGGILQGGPFPVIAFTHLLVAVTMRGMVTGHDATVFEIGGGFGGLAYFACRLVKCCYTIFDLAWANAVQAYFLHRALPGHKLALCGEKSEGRDIVLMPAWALFRQPPGTRVDLVVNQDSMPEMPYQTACAYLDVMKTFLRGPFLSVNQEPPEQADSGWGGKSVAHLTDVIGGYVRFSRAPFFLRLGYVEEIYYPTTAGHIDPGAPLGYEHPLRVSRGTPLRTAYYLLKRGEFRGLRDRLGRRLRSLIR
jgi:hypothetical protein